jgi:nucleotide-binding universal stress UspA family protein
VSTGRIVVGVDGSPASEAALRFAAEEARFRGATLRVVHAWRIPLSVAAPEPSILGYAVLPEASVEEMRATFEEEAKRLLDSAVEGIEGLDVEPLLVEDAPAQALIRASADADLLVVGSRGRGGFKGLLLGSVSQQCAHHSSCPVVIVPHGRRQ